MLENSFSSINVKYTHTKYIKPSKKKTINDKHDFSLVLRKFFFTYFNFQNMFSLSYFDFNSEG